MRSILWSYFWATLIVGGFIGIAALIVMCPPLAVIIFLFFVITLIAAEIRN